ncbi:hypothetical protein ACEI36_14895, partial [Pseudomonas kielensis]|uniref:hypothetical protein n=1 Tax=Pseudomonas kielensis TaxID=2762577 RepID=UPI00389C8CF5
PQPHHHHPRGEGARPLATDRVPLKSRHVTRCRLRELARSHRELVEGVCSVELCFTIFFGALRVKKKSERPPLIDFLGPLKKILTKGRELRICHGHAAGRVWTTGIVKGIDDAVE